jgi:hypothetical protein
MKRLLTVLMALMSLGVMAQPLEPYRRKVEGYLCTLVHINSATLSI